jgi:SAM-dependent methyltransferase
VLYLNFCRDSLRLAFTGTLFITSLCIMVVGARDIGIWSPYNHISVKKVLPDGRQQPVVDRVSNIGTMRDPPFFVIQVNHDFYMLNGTIDNLRYTDFARSPLALKEQYSLPYLIRPGVKDVLVVGSGGGVDVEAALLHGAERVDAVEIDPVIIKIGHQYNASQSYKDPRVSIHNTDARAFFKQANKDYDVIVFGFLDSQGLFSHMSSIRLDGYVYTRESFQEAFGLLRPGGLMSISFFSAGKEWLTSRLISMVHSATGMEPLVYVKRTGQITVLAGKEFSPTGPQRFISYQRITPLRAGTLEAVDDWPYLYLRERFIPLDYLITSGLLLAISLLFILLSSGNKGKGLDLHFFFLGAGFLLLETKSVTTVSLYFGTTWLVSMLVILGVLLMVLLANLVASRSSGSSLIFYYPLVASIAFLYIFPAQTVLGWSFLTRLMFSLVIIPLPIFFAGLIFSMTFRETGDPSLSFGSNLLGAMVGGFAEYLGMVTGTRALLLIVIVFYLASLMVRLRFSEALSSRA